MGSRRNEPKRAPEPKRAARVRDAFEARRADLVVYALAALIAGLVLVGLASVLIGGLGDGASAEEYAGAIGDCERAQIEPASGTAVGLACDDRDGAALPELALGDLERAVTAAGCRLATELRVEGTRHVANTASPRYRTVPATSGPMYEQTIADGAYLTTPPEPSVVHSIEHGRVTIQYSPRLPEADQVVLKALFDEDPSRVLLFPNPRVGDGVAATAWTDLLRCPDYGERVIDALRAFRDLHRGHAPEG